MQYFKLFAIGILCAFLTNQSIAAPRYYGGEVQWEHSYTGDVEFFALAQCAGGDGIVNGFFLYRPGSEQSGTYWAELDIEILGNNTSVATMDIHFGNPDPNHPQDHRKRRQVMDIRNVSTGNRALDGGFYWYGIMRKSDVVQRGIWRSNWTGVSWDQRRYEDIVDYQSGGERVWKQGFVDAAMQPRINLWAIDAPGWTGSINGNALNYKTLKVRSTHIRGDRNGSRYDARHNFTSGRSRWKAEGGYDLGNTRIRTNNDNNKIYNNSELHLQLRYRDNNGRIGDDVTESASALSAYPNPASGAVQLSGHNGSAQVFDMNGSLVDDLSLDGDQSFGESYEAGTYIIKSGDQTTKLIKQ